MNKQIVYPTKGVCSQAIAIELEGDVVKSVQFMGGCQGNTQGISMLVRGMKVEDVIARLEGINCGGKGTSCPDQLARALRLMTNRGYEEDYKSVGGGAYLPLLRLRPQQ